MVIMVVRYENLADSAKRDPCHRELPGDAVPCVNDVRLIVDDQYISRL